jgi:hypothetical protein
MRASEMEAERGEGVFTLVNAVSGPVRRQGMPARYFLLPDAPLPDPEKMILAMDWGIEGRSSACPAA